MRSTARLAALPLAILLAACDHAVSPTAPAGPVSVAGSELGAAIYVPPEDISLQIQGENAGYAGVPVTLVYDVRNPTGAAFACAIRKDPADRGSIAYPALASCSGSVQMKTPVYSNYSRQDCGQGGECYAEFLVTEKGLLSGALRFFDARSMVPYSIKDVVVLTRPAAGEPSRTYADHCGGDYRTACVAGTVFAPGVLAGSTGAVFGPFVVTVTWGDGTSTTATRTAFNAPLLARHQYAAAGTYQVSIVARTVEAGGTFVLAQAASSTTVTVE